MPQRSAALGAAARQKERPRGALAELGCKERGRAELAKDEVHRFGCIEEEDISVRWLIGVREAQDESVVCPHGFDIGAAGCAESSSHGHRPGSMNPTAEGGKDADAPVPKIVAATLDYDVAIIWHSDGC